MTTRDTVAIRLPGYRNRQILMPDEVMLHADGCYQRLTRAGMAHTIRTCRALGSPVPRRVDGSRLFAGPEIDGCNDPSCWPDHPDADEIPSAEG